MVLQVAPSVSDAFILLHALLERHKTQCKGDDADDDHLAQTFHQCGCAKEIGGGDVSCKCEWNDIGDERPNEFLVDFEWVFGEIAHLVEHEKDGLAALQPKCQRCQKQLDACVDQRREKEHGDEDYNFARGIDDIAPDGGIDHEYDTNNHFTDTIRLKFLGHNLKERMHWPEHVAVEFTVDDYIAGKKPKVVREHVVESAGDIGEAVDEQKVEKRPSEKIRNLLKDKCDESDTAELYHKEGEEADEEVRAGMHEGFQVLAEEHAIEFEVPFESFDAFHVNLPKS